MNLLQLIAEAEVKTPAPETKQVLALAREAIEGNKAQVFQLNQKLDNTQKELNTLYAYLEQGFDDFASQLVATINDPDKYFRAGVMYNQSWFCSLPYSIDKKVQLTRMLIDVVSGYNDSYVPSLWTSIVARDLNTLQSIRFFKMGAPGNVL